MGRLRGECLALAVPPWWDDPKDPPALARFNSVSAQLIVNSHKHATCQVYTSQVSSVRLALLMTRYRARHLLGCLL